MSSPICIKYANGSKLWYLNDRIHREDGPAYEGVDGEIQWFLNGKEYKEDDYWREIFKRGLITEKELFLKLL
jgi:hypothetical protein